MVMNMRNDGRCFIKELTANISAFGSTVKAQNGGVSLVVSTVKAEDGGVSISADRVSLPADRWAQVEIPLEA